MTVCQIHPGRDLRQSVSAWAILAMLGVNLVPSCFASRTAEDQRRADSLAIQWIEVDAGTFTMESGDSAQRVTVGRFMMSATEITFDQYDTFCDATGRGKPDDNNWGRGTRPVLNVSYDDAIGFCKWLSEETGSTIRLPNEAEWEYAARGGCHSGGYIHSGSNNKDDVSWNEDNSGGRPHPVGTRKPNELGLFDMSGNLWEWCSDWPGTNPNGASSESVDTWSDGKRALHGNSFDNPGSRMGFRLSLRLERSSCHINIGFRVAKSE